MMYSIVERTLAPQPVIVVRKRVRLSDFGETTRSALRRIGDYGQRHALVLADPFTRYIEVRAAEMVIESGMRVAAGAERVSQLPAGYVGDERIIPGTLPGGVAATALHFGPYETLIEAHAAIDQWMERHGYSAAGHPWERYITSPDDCLDPWQWRTEVFWPILPAPRIS